MTIGKPPLSTRSGRKAAPKLRCARCDTRLADPSRRIYSTHTRTHYCSAVDACARRAARKTKKVAA